METKTGICYSEKWKAYFFSWINCKVIGYMGKFPLELLDFINCPSCKGDFIFKNNSLKCSGCNKLYEIKRGIPILLDPVSINYTIEKEFELFNLMKSKDTDFSLAKIEWEKSKDDFFEVIKKYEITFDCKKILNIGCGRDNIFAKLEGSKSFYINADLVFDILLELQEKGAKYLVNCDVNHLPFKDHVFDIVFCIDLIHHFYTRSIFRPLENMVRVLSLGGRIYIEEVNKFGLLRLPIGLFPDFLYFFLRRARDKLSYKKDYPAEYEAPLSMMEVNKILIKLGISNLKAERCMAYPTNNKLFLRIFNKINKYSIISKSFSYHWLIHGLRLK